MRLARLTVLAFVLVGPAAQADGLSTLQDLAKRNLRPAPLVPTSGPPILRPRLERIDHRHGQSERHHGQRQGHRQLRRKRV